MSPRRPKALPSEELGKKKSNWYAGFCRLAGRYIKAPDEFKKEEYKLALDFLGWDLRPREVNAAPIMGLVLSGLASGAVLFYVFMYMRLSMLLLMYVLPILVLAPILITYYLQTYVLSAVRAEKIRSLNSIPEIVNYLVMSMKLTPNLEKAVEFAAEHGSGKIAEDLKRVVWGTRVGMYRSMEEGMDEIAYRWGSFSDHLKRALMLIRSSVIEIDEAKRNALLDKAVADVTSGIHDDMSAYVLSMKQPTIYLYYVGVLLPLMLIIMLPIGAVMAKLPLAQTPYMIGLYNIGIPFFTFLFARSILKKRPPVYEAPTIPDDYPGLPPKGHMRLGKGTVPAALVGIMAAITIYAVLAWVVDPVVNPVPSPWKKVEHMPFFAIMGAMLGPVVAISIYLYGTSYAKRRVQKETIVMENQFQDSVYVLASRLGENRPIEEAMKYTSEFLMGAREIKAVFRQAVENIVSLGMTMQTALFDPVYGALRNIPSRVIRGSMRIVVDSIALGSQQAARSLVGLSMQLRESQKLKQEMAVMLEDATSTMKSMATFIAPMVLGITTALQKIVVGALASAAPSVAAKPVTLPPGATGLPSLPQVSLGSAAELKAMPDSATFLLIMGLYILEITVILIYFTSKVEEGENRLALRMNLARVLPLSIALFFMVAWFTLGLAPAL